ncbi:transglycosylase family protein [Streptomyces sp. NPDC085946]|uniref:transglycosylase family protein n=1 Tax=Streptomyces sp. NPDC085946 TaxID=3365744 RepID=UPI0037D6ADF7
MLSGNGRHRRPRQAPALLVAAGVTGSAIAIPLLGAGGASAADGTTWDRVAECESGGAWSQNNGNGYYGGLQVTQEDWENHGGLDYAPSADQASRSQQIAVAERILADQGVGAWRTCGLLAGLEKDSASVEVDTGVAKDATGTSGSPSSSGLTDSSKSSASPDPAESTEGADSSGSAGASTASPSASASPSVSPSSDDVSDKKGKTSKSDASRDDVAESGSPSAAAPEGDAPAKSVQGDGSSAPADTATTGTGRHRGPSAEESAQEARTAEAAGRHASRDDGAARGGVNGSYTVRAGDSLWSIADSLDYDGGWNALYAGNEQVVGADPDLIQPGQALEVETGADEK